VDAYLGIGEGQWGQAESLQHALQVGQSAGNERLERGNLGINYVCSWLEQGIAGLFPVAVTPGNSIDLRVSIVAASGTVLLEIKGKTTRERERDTEAHDQAPN
jgi:hypothetical protein